MCSCMDSHKVSFCGQRRDLAEIMSPGISSFLRRWFVTTIGVLVASNVVSGVQADNVGALLAASLVLGVLNALLRPIMMILTFPLMIVTLGLFTFVINA